MVAVFHPESAFTASMARHWWAVAEGRRLAERLRSASSDEVPGGEVPDADEPQIGLVDLSSVPCGPAGWPEPGRAA